MTEHAAVIFVFFFLAGYASIVLICILTSIFFLGGLTTKILDNGSITYIGPYGLKLALLNLAKKRTTLDLGIMFLSVSPKPHKYLSSPLMND
jgi:NADH:ubiquinone oxidoreductase subunit H